MLQFRQSDISAVIILTLTERATLSSPKYLFVFTHVTTRQVVSFIKAYADDESVYKNRYNQFTINASTLFTGQPGEYHYTVYEQSSSTNTNTELTGKILEHGKMILDRTADFGYVKYEASTSFKTYNG